MNTEAVVREITRLKSLHKKLHTNCFAQLSSYGEQEWQAAFSQDSGYILNRDHGVGRIWFYTADFQDLAILMQGGLDEKEEYVVDILAKDAAQYQSELQEMGFSEFARMMRMSNADVSATLKSSPALMEHYDSRIGMKAGLKDAQEIHRKLWEIFDSRISHLPALEEVEESICREEFYLQRAKDGSVGALLQRVVAPKSFYINQIYNGMGKEVIHAILLRELQKYCENGGKYAYAWVEERNAASVRFHGKYGLRHDGLWNVVYRK